MRTLRMALTVTILCAMAAAASGQPLWSEDFETMECGELPDGWVDAGGNDDYGTVWDVGGIVCGGSYALGAYGTVGGGCWAGMVACPIIPSSPGNVFLLSVEFTVRVGDEPASECGGRAFLDMSAGTHWQDDRRGLFVVSETGDFYGSGEVFGTGALESCHNVQIDYERVEPDSVSLVYWFDGGVGATMTLPEAAFEDNLVYLHWGSLEGSSWFDDIAVTAAPVATLRTSWGAVKTGYTSPDEE
jgi:hypothetical protein